MMTVVDGSEKSQSCLTCRMIGTTVCLGVSAHLVYSSTKQRGVGPMAASPMSRAFVLAFAGGFAALGVARAVVN